MTRLLCEWCEEPLQGKQARFCCPSHRALWHRHRRPDVAAEESLAAQVAQERRAAKATRRKKQRDLEEIRKLPCLICAGHIERSAVGRHRSCCSDRCRMALSRLRRNATGESAVKVFAGRLRGTESLTEAFGSYRLWTIAAKVPFLDRPGWLFDALSKHGVTLAG
jgi:endogenous inhibitor of DNA gyrase (YacG/DUF329 family)